MLSLQERRPLASFCARLRGPRQAAEIAVVDPEDIPGILVLGMLKELMVLFKGSTASLGAVDLQSALMHARMHDLPRSKLQRKHW